MTNQPMSRVATPGSTAASVSAKAETRVQMRRRVELSSLERRHVRDRDLVEEPGRDERERERREQQKGDVFEAEIGPNVGRRQPYRGPPPTPGQSSLAAKLKPTPPPTYTAIEQQTATKSVTRMQSAGLANFELMARPKAVLSQAKIPSRRKASRISLAVTPPNKNGKAPTGASITM